ncbi:helix-turn-helix domain-containing protein [Paraburkholderia caffeinilytica]|uniref:helix-turn-helix domain-containing protein n=1 Tax=Paraburkholderia caffeinilytica TaxID=1761016 RepID=UPI003DA15F68
MNHGLDLSACQFTTDHEGKRLRVDMPIRLFDLLVEFRNAALRAQTEAMERTTPRGTFRSSLADLPGRPDSEPLLCVPVTPLSLAPPTRRERAEGLFLTPEERLMREASRAVDFPACSVEASQGSARMVIDSSQSTPSSKRKRRIFFPRVFVEPIPDEVAKQIGKGTYFLRAWRLHRELSPVEAAELAGLSRDTIVWHENGYNVPNADTLKRFADIYDCTVGQLSAQPGSPTMPDDQQDSTARAHAIEFAPDDTEYPDAVMAHLMAGKSPLTAWRMHRRMTIEQCAKAYGSTPANIKVMEGLPVLRDRTRKRLAIIFTCKPVQLLLPEGLATQSLAAPGAVPLDASRRRDSGKGNTQRAYV